MSHKKNIKNEHLYVILVKCFNNWWIFVFTREWSLQLQNSPTHLNLKIMRQTVHMMTYLPFIVLCIVIHLFHISQFDLTTWQRWANISLIQKIIVIHKNRTKLYYTLYQLLFATILYNILQEMFFTTTLDPHLIRPNILPKPSSPQEKFMMKRLSQFLRIFIPHEWKLVHSKPYLSHMISKKNPSILK